MSSSEPKNSTENVKVPVWKRLSPEELIDRGLCPVQKEHVREVSRRVLVNAVGAGGATGDVQKKSKRQMKKDRNDAKNGPGICNHYIKGHCTHEKCKYLHDVEAFLASKAPDIPGRCPFRNVKDGGCPYGIACRWANSHETHPPQFAEAMETFVANSKAGGAPETSAAGGKVTVCGELVDDDGSIPHGIVELDPIEGAENEMNVLRKDLQTQLRKGKYDFSKSFEILKSVGVPIYVRKKEREEEKPTEGTEGGEPSSKRARTMTGGEEKEVEGDKASTAPGQAAIDTKAAVAAGGPGATTETAKGSSHMVAGGTAETDIAEDAAARTKSLSAEDGPAHLAEGKVRFFDVTRAAEGNGAYRESPLRESEKKEIDWNNKLYLAPLTTVGNLPFRRLCKRMGVDITIGEMALATNLLQGQAGEWALLKRHPEEDLFGVQVCGGYPDAMCKVAQLIEENCTVDFVDCNMGCPIDLICNKGAGSALLQERNQGRMKKIVRSMSQCLSVPLTIKIRKGYLDNKDLAHRDIVPVVKSWGASALTLHGRTRQQRYSRLADWQYIQECARLAEVPLIGNGDIYSWRDFEDNVVNGSVATGMIARGALIKPWIFTEIKEKRDWDISASERLDILKMYVSFGLEHWGSDKLGVETTRRFLLEWLSYLHRYVPVGLLEVLPPRMHLRPPAIYGRNHLETLLSSDNAADWVRISEMLLGPAPPNFVFSPKHKTNSYATTPSDLAGLEGAVPGDGAPGAEEQENG